MYCFQVPSLYVCYFKKRTYLDISVFQIVKEHFSPNVKDWSDRHQRRLALYNVGANLYMLIAKLPMEQYFLFWDTTVNIQLVPMMPEDKLPPILGLLGMYFDAAVVFITKSLLFTDILCGLEFSNLIFQNSTVDQLGLKFNFRNFISIVPKSICDIRFRYVITTYPFSLVLLTQVL